MAGGARRYIVFASVCAFSVWLVVAAGVLGGGAVGAAAESRPPPAHLDPARDAAAVRAWPPID
eukprot:gene15714-7282_t